MSKVSVVKEPDNFRKITLAIEIESEAEHKALMGLFRCDCTVPDFVQAIGHLSVREHDALRELFTHAYTKL